MTPVQTAPYRNRRLDRSRHTGVGILLVFLPLVESCVSTIDLKRMTYEALRQADCRENQLDAFCQRNFANEYAEYERLRRHFIRDTADSPWRAHRDPEQ